MSILILLLTYALLIGVFIVLGRRVKPWVYSLVAAVWCIIWAVVSLVEGNQIALALNAFMASYWVYDFWRKKPPGIGRKVAKAIGAKARAVKAKVVASMPKVSPVGKPVLAPVGA